MHVESKVKGSRILWKADGTSLWSVARNVVIVELGAYRLYEICLSILVGKFVGCDITKHVAEILKPRIDVIVTTLSHTTQTRQAYHPLT